MNKIFSLMSVVAIMFVAIFAATPTVTHAAPVIEVSVSKISLNPSNNTIHIYTTLTNVGDQNAEVYRLDVTKFALYNSSGKCILDCGNFSLDINPCYVKAGYHVDNVEWVIHGNRVPNYNGKFKKIKLDCTVVSDTVK